MSVSKLYTQWINNAKEDIDLINELKAIEGFDDEINDRFYTNLEFGTAGLRGTIGAGTNRMNIYTVRKTTKGLATYLNSRYKDACVAISYDSRIKSELFAKEAARVLISNGIKVFISNELKPVPVLSFMVRNLKCQAGIMITASHNPAKYNGYKCYGDDGCQMTELAAAEVYRNIEKTDMFPKEDLPQFFDGIKTGYIQYVPEQVYTDYIDCVYSQAINNDLCFNTNVKVVYTPLNGAGNKFVRNILNRIGVRDISVVKEQENPDGNFPTCPYPNPEVKEALKLSLDLAEKENPDIVIATDPDSDRIAVSVNNGVKFTTLTGNELGILLTNYILSGKKEVGILPKNPLVVKTIVSSEMVRPIAYKYGCELIDVLTGFKYIGEQILLLENNHEENRFVFGFEESCGYLLGTYVRDKDAVVASMLVCEMVAFYKESQKTLLDVLDELYKEYGYYKSTNLNFEFEGALGLDKMSSIMEALRKTALTEIAGLKVLCFDDYQKSISLNLDTNQQTPIYLPKSNVLSYTLEQGNKVIIRPSGTEPKIKVYITSVGNSEEISSEWTEKITKNISSMIQ